RPGRAHAPLQAAVLRAPWCPPLLDTKRTTARAHRSARSLFRAQREYRGVISRQHWVVRGECQTIAPRGVLSVNGQDDLTEPGVLNLVDAPATLAMSATEPSATRFDTLF